MAWDVEDVESLFEHRRAMRNLSAFSAESYLHLFGCESSINSKAASDEEYPACHPEEETRSTATMASIRDSSKRETDF